MSFVLPLSRHSLPRHTAAVVACGLLLACASGDESAVPGAEGDAESVADAPMADAAPTEGAYAPDDVGNGSVTYGGVQYDGFRGTCMISRRNGRDPLGDLADREGLRMIAGVDNTEADPANGRNFKVYSDSLFTTRGEAGGIERGTLTQVAEQSARAPYGTSTSMYLALVSFTGATADGVPVEARLVCELQDQFN